MFPPKTHPESSLPYIAMDSKLDLVISLSPLCILQHFCNGEVCENDEL